MWFLKYYFQKWSDLQGLVKPHTQTLTPLVMFLNVSKSYNH